MRLPANIFSHDVQTDKITLGDFLLDSVLGGGVPCKQITEFVGESSTGKTQIMIQLALTVQWPVHCGGLQGSCIYISTESENWIKRAIKMAAVHLHKFGMGGRVAMENIFVRKFAGNANDLFDELLNLNHVIAQQNTPVRLLIIDSFAGPFRGIENNVASLSLRASVYFKIAQLAKYYACQYNIAVVVTNHVVDNVFNKISSKKFGVPRVMWSYVNRARVALGIAWSNCINNRIMITRAYGHWNKENILVSTSPLIYRTLHVVLSGHIPPGSCYFKVDDSGVSSASDGNENQ